MKKPSLPKERKILYVILWVGLRAAMGYVGAKNIED
jgi:hypothetical protein